MLTGGYVLAKSFQTIVRSIQSQVRINPRPLFPRLSYGRRILDTPFITDLIFAAGT